MGEVYKRSFNSVIIVQVLTITPCSLACEDLHFIHLASFIKYHLIHRQFYTTSTLKKWILIPLLSCIAYKYVCTLSSFYCMYPLLMQILDHYEKRVLLLLYGVIEFKSSLK